MEKSDIGMIGLAVMGSNLALNMESKGFGVSVFDREQYMIDDFVKAHPGKNFYGPTSLQDFVASLKAPRKIMMMIKAGQPVDDYIEKLCNMLEPGDIIIDGGNTHFPDTERRMKYVESKGLLYIGTGVSGGEEGALKGPSMMPGGSVKAWPEVKGIFQAICAKVDSGDACCDWVGEGGAGHFVKMVHNGIEYGDIQLICECYSFMKNILGMDNAGMQTVFAEWNKGDLDSYLIEITRDILGKKDVDGSYVLDNILDTAGQKGTGKWTAIAALDNGVPLTLIAESVFARCLSAIKDERVSASKILAGPATTAANLTDKERAELLEDLRKALFAAKVVSYAQGYALMRSAAKEYGWNLNYGGIALMWRGGCIIRSVFLGKIKEAFDKNPEIANIMLDPFFAEKLAAAQVAWRNIICTAVRCGLPVPCLSAGLEYYDGYRCSRLPANLLQAQRDFFGAHTYERNDAPRGKFFHTVWKP